MSTLAIILCFVLALIGLGLFGRGALMAIESGRLDSRLAHLGGTPSSSPFRLVLPAWLAARGADRTEIIARLREAGFQGNAAIDRFLWLRVGATGTSLVLAMLFCKWTWGGFAAKPALLLIVPAFTYVGAKSALRFIAKSRSRAVTAEFPFFLDLILMMLESGVSLDQCFRSIASEDTSASPQLQRATRVLVDDLDRRMSYEDALARWSARVAVPGAKELASLFQQALFNGVELSSALREFVREFTERRVSTAREATGRIAVQMVVVMILFFMPALFIVIGGPPATALFDTMRKTTR